MYKSNFTLDVEKSIESANNSTSVGVHLASPLPLTQIQQIDHTCKGLRVPLPGTNEKVTSPGWKKLALAGIQF